MKIVHVCLCGPYTDGFAYQDNILPQKHLELGYEVNVLISQRSFNNKGNIIFRTCKNYKDSHGIEISIIPYDKHFGKVAIKLGIFKDLALKLNQMNPDIIFVHGLQFISITDILTYKMKNKKVKIYVDNHADYINTPLNSIKRRIIQKGLFGNIGKNLYHM